MDRTLVLRLFFFSAALVLTTSLSHVSAASCCSQELCNHLSERLEDQSVRLHSIEAALLRTVSILASVNDPQFSAASLALKSDPLINSILITGDDHHTESTFLRSQPRLNWPMLNVQGKKLLITQVMFMYFIKGYKLPFL